MHACGAGNPARGPAFQRVLPAESRLPRSPIPPRPTVRTRRQYSTSCEERQIRFSYSDAAKARAVTRELTARIIENNLRIRTNPLPLEQLDPPGVPQRPYTPNRFGITAAGFALGLAFGLMVWGIRRWPVAALAGAAASLVAAGLSFLIADSFVSVAVLKLDAPLTPEFREQVLQRESATDRRPPGTQSVSRRAEKMSIEAIVERLRQNISNTLTGIRLNK